MGIRLLRLLGLWGPVVLWMALIFKLSSQSVQPHLTEPLFDAVMRKAAHVGEYALLALLVERARTGAFFRPRREALLFAFVLTVLYGATDELHQGFVPGRQAALTDVGVDAGGAALGLVAHWLALGRGEKSPSP